MEFVPLQLKMKNLYYKKHNDDGYNETIYIENSDKGFFEKIRKMWNKITKWL